MDAAKWASHPHSTGPDVGCNGRRLCSHVDAVSIFFSDTSRFALPRADSCLNRRNTPIQVIPVPNRLIQVEIQKKKKRKRKGAKHSV